MKSTSIKRITLNREIVRRLSNANLNEILGGNNAATMSACGTRTCQDANTRSPTATCHC